MATPYTATVFDPGTLRVMFQAVRVELLGNGGVIFIESDELVPNLTSGLVQVPEAGQLTLVFWPVTAKGSRTIHFKMLDYPTELRVTPVEISPTNPMR